MKKVILFDIDYTLFDSSKFRKKLYSAIKISLKKKDIHVPDEKLVNAYKVLRNEVPYFSPRIFAKKLGNEIGEKIDEDFLETEIFGSIIFNHNLYEEVLEVFKMLSKIEDLEIGIFSTGEEKFQGQKINEIINLLNSKHIHIHLYKDDNLTTVVKKYKEMKLILVDDVLKILAKASSIDQDLITIWIERKEKSEFNKNDYIGDFKPSHEIKNLNEVVSIIKNI